MKIRVKVTAVEYGVFEYEGTEEDLKANLGSIVETAEEEGMIFWNDRAVKTVDWEKDE